MLRFLRREPGFYRHTWMLALPIILQNLITTSLGFVDTFMVGLLGQPELSAVTAANTPIFLVQIIIFGLLSGLSVLVSQYWGKQEMESINRVLGVALWVVLVVSTLFAGVLLVCPVEFLSLFGNEPEVIALAAQYGSIAGLSYVCNAFTMMYVAAYRSMERPQLGLYILVASMTVNTFLNWVFIFGKLGAPAMGVRGAAVATLTARLLEVTIVVLHMMKNRFFRVHLHLLLRLRKIRRRVSEYLVNSINSNKAFVCSKITDIHIGKVSFQIIMTPVHLSSQDQDSHLLTPVKSRRIRQRRRNNT